MKLLKFSFDHLCMFEDGIFKLDLFAEDRVPKSDQSVSRLFGNVYTNNVVAFAGINASGKTMSLALTDFALDIVSGLSVNHPTEMDYFIDLFDEKTLFRGLISTEEGLFLLESSIGVHDKPINISRTGRSFVIEEEIIYKIPKALTRKELTANLDVLSALGHPITTRSTEESRIRKLLGEDRSIFVSYADDHPLSIRLLAEERELPPRDIEESASFFRIFDSSIKSIVKDEVSGLYELTISGRDEPLALPSWQLKGVLSSGTVKGSEIALFVLEVIKNGSYLLIDEIENHLNKKLVQMIIELFSSAETNPNGATLIFTTHYPEILDCIHRKDCVYFFVRNEDGKISKVKYSERVGRIENKKSEVFISNYIKGTAPKYAEVSFFRNLAKEIAHGRE